MPYFEIAVEVSYSGTEFYRIEADSPEAAIEKAKSGEAPPYDEDMSSDYTNWDEATVDGE